MAGNRDAIEQVVGEAQRGVIGAIEKKGGAVQATILQEQRAERPIRRGSVKVIAASRDTIEVREAKLGVGRRHTIVVVMDRGRAGHGAAAPVRCLFLDAVIARQVIVIEGSSFAHQLAAVLQPDAG